MIEKPIIVRFDFSKSGETGSIWFVCQRNPSGSSIVNGVVYYPYRMTTSPDNGGIFGLDNVGSLTVDTSGNWAVNITDNVNSWSIDATFSGTPFSESTSDWSGHSGAITAIEAELPDTNVIDEGFSYGFYVIPDSNYIVDFYAGFGVGGAEQGAFSSDFITQAGGGNYVEVDPNGYLGTSLNYGPNGTLVGALLPDYVLVAAGGDYQEPDPTNVFPGVSYGPNGTSTGTGDPISFIGSDNVWDASGGTLALPSDSDVRAGATYGPGGTEFVGSLNGVIIDTSGSVSGTGVLDINAAVWADGVLDGSGNRSTLDYAVDAAGGNIPAAAVAQDADTVSGTYSGELLRYNILANDHVSGDPVPYGTFVAPATSVVQKDQTYGAANDLTGTYDPVTGNYTNPGISHVQEGTTYKFDGSTLTGTLAVESNGAGSPVHAHLVLQGPLRWLYRRAKVELSGSGVDGIYYSRDGAPPVPGDPNTHQYTSPVLISSDFRAVTKTGDVLGPVFRLTHSG